MAPLGEQSHCCEDGAAVLRDAQQMAVPARAVTTHKRQEHRDSQVPVCGGRFVGRRRTGTLVVVSFLREEARMSPQKWSLELYPLYPDCKRTRSSGLLWWQS